MRAHPGRRTAPALRPRDVLGVPALPPGRATVAGNRVRSALGRVHTAAAPPPLRVLEALFGLLDHRVLVVLCEAGVPDALQHPTAIEALAEQLALDPVMLRRLCEFADVHGWVRIDRKGRVRPTRVTRFLRSDHPGGWGSWAQFAGGVEVVAAVQRLSLSPTPQDPFAEANGQPFFEWMHAHPDRWASDDEATRILTRIAAALPVDGRVIVVDNDPSMMRSNSIAAATDVLMAALTPGGRERTTAELMAIGDAAGLRYVRTVRLASADLAHCFGRIE